MRPPPPGLAVIRSSPLFDATWYAHRHPDVGQSGMHPAAHFLRFGRVLRRPAGPDFDTQFCMDTYADIRRSRLNPLVVHHLAAETDPRPTTPAERDRIVRVSKAGWTPHVAVTLLLRGDHPSPRLDRSINSALQACAGHGNAEVVVSADPGLDLCRHMARRWPVAWAAGLLRGAKTGAGDRIGGTVLMIQLGQEVSAQEFMAMEVLAAEHKTGFVLHRLSGPWDDPASHQIAMPGWIFRSLRRDARRLPWSDDGTDLLLSALRRFPAVPLLREEARDSVLRQNPYLRDLVAWQPLANITKVVDVATPPPLPRAAPPSDLVRQSTAFNAALSAMAQLRDPPARQQMLHRLNRHKIRIIETASATCALEGLFAPQKAGSREPVAPQELSLFVCVRDEADFLAVLVPHYRSLGVSRFFVVDDGSAMPVTDLQLGPDVAVFRPLHGDFRSSKTLWIECLMKAFLSPGAWTLTVDADEFLRLPAPFTDLQSLIDHLEAKGRDFATALLLDMVPGPEAMLGAPSTDPRQGMTHFLDDSRPACASYLQAPTVTWGFGHDWGAVSWRFDVRHRLFGTLDSLRKIPLFRYRGDRHPNQGFHTFDHLDPSRDPGPDIWRQGPVLPLSHYKLARLFDDDHRGRMLAQAGNYHADTSANIARAFAGPATTALQALRDLTPHLRPAEQADRVTRAFRDGPASG